MRTLVPLPALLAFCSLAMGAAFAQTSDAALSGTITDPSGAPAAGAQVRAKNVITGVSLATRANEYGIYTFPALQPGRYELTVECTGFKLFQVSDLALGIGARETLNGVLEIGGVTDSVRVAATAENVVASEVSTGGSVGGQRLLDLPVLGRTPFAFVALQAGVVGENIAGMRLGMLNITMDGLNVMDQRNHRGLLGAFGILNDRVEEVRVITSPADAEYGRGGPQIQLLSRSGGNEFHGSLFEAHRNTALNANTWFNNQRGVNPETGAPVTPRPVLIRNQFGGRVGGPIRRNKTFFHFLADMQRTRQAETVTSTVYTAAARQGLFRFFPGVQNGNANAAVPTVDLLGNPVRPPRAAGDLMSVSLFGRDPNRGGPDPTGVVRRLLELAPPPNDFRAGDGLNTAGYTWQRVRTFDFDDYSVRVDHYFTPVQRIGFSFTSDIANNANGYMAQPVPAGPGGASRIPSQHFGLFLTSALRPDLLNEVRIGVLRNEWQYITPWQISGFDLLPVAGGHPYAVVFGGITTPFNTASDSQGRRSPLYQLGNNTTWMRGKHAYKAGVEVRFTSNNAYNDLNTLPRVNLGTGGQPVQNLNAIPGIGQNQGAAETLLNQLAGSVSSIVQAFNSPGGAQPVFLAGESQQRTFRQREFTFFAKDEWRWRTGLTLHLGVRYEWYGVPYETNGKAVAPDRGAAGMFGVSGSSEADLFQPGSSRGEATRLVTVGPRSMRPDRRLFANDWNNLAPAVGLSWSLPSWAGGTAVFRAGYGIYFERIPFVVPETVAGSQPGLREQRTFTSSSYLDLRSVSLPLQPLGTPLSTVPFTDRTQTVRAYADTLRTPYVQSWNASLERSLGGNATIQVRYVGSKGTRLIRSFDVNEANILETGILDAFRAAQTGAESPLLNRLFQGLNIPGLGVVDGTRITGSAAVRTISTTQPQLASNNVGAFASYLSSTDQFTGERGGLLRRAGLPENWAVANPQFASARLTDSLANSTYHSMVIEMNRRFAGGWTVQGNYTWSRALGEDEGSAADLAANYRTLRDRSQDKRLMSYHRTHVVRSNGIWSLPFGPKRKFGASWTGVAARLIEGWQAGVAASLLSGPPIGLFGTTNTFNNFGGATAMAAGNVPGEAGSVTRTGNGVVYFPEWQQVRDPSTDRMTAAQGLSGRSALRAIADSAGRLLVLNAQPGELGNLSRYPLEGPGQVLIDLSLIKRVAIGERVNFEIRADAINATNRPNFSAPNTDINSTNFGRITGTGGARIMVITGRINF